MPDAQADYEIEFDDADKDWMARQAVKDRELADLKARADAADAAKTDRELAKIQGAAAGVRPAVVQGTVTEDPHDKITFMDREFRVADKIGLMPMLKFASAADIDVQDPRALAAMYAMLRDSVYEGEPGCGSCEHCAAGNDTQCKSYDKGDWGSFEEHAMVTKAGAEELFDVIKAVLELVAGRPTQPPAGSSSGPRSSPGRSTARSSARRGKASRR